MSEPRTYAFEQGLADDGRVQSALTWIRQAGFSPAFMPDRLVIYGASGAVRAELYGAEQIIGFARKLSIARPTTPRAPDAASLAVDVRDLQETVRYLRDRWHLALARADELQKRALAAEEELHNAKGPSGRLAEPRYQELRRFIARELHPDHAPGSPELLALKGELFKLIWAEVGRLDKT